MEEKEIKYFLVLERRTGDYNIININQLDICNSYTGNDLLSIDCFTAQFSEEEIRLSIIKNNIVHSDYYDGNMKVISDAKHNFKILTKDMLNVIKKFQIDNTPFSGELKTKLFGAYKKVIDTSFKDASFIKGMLDRFKIAIKNNNKEEVFSILEELPYKSVRTIYFTIYDVIKKEN